ncbi:MAG TPA: glycosyltransferase family 2 protein [Roseiflexaceae bacterium]|nr:glycosyltransferase family 2 protein [Roseiflexaceae bacterium]
MRPLLSVVVVNSGGAADTMRCLESIERHPPDLALAARAGALPEVEVVLVDNRSRDGCLEMAQRRFPGVVTLEAPERQGFARNYNMGLRAARGAFVLVLNNDTLVHAGALTRLLDAMVNGPSYGMVGPRMVNRSGATQTDCARPLPTPASYVWQQLALDPGMLVGRLWERWIRRAIGRRASGPVACIGGACMLVRREALEQVGPLDEGFVFYYEDVEWCHRMWRSGWEVGYVADAQVTHLGDQSLSKVKVWAKRSEYLSALRYFRQYHRLTPVGAQVIWLVTCASWLLRGVVFLLAEALAGRRGYAREYFYLWRWVFGAGRACAE